MIRSILTILISACCIVLKAQNDPQAKAILDQVSAKNKAYKTISTNFTIAGSNTQNDEKMSKKGSLLIKGDKYQLKLPESETYFDGKDVYSFLPASDEVSISKPQASSKKTDDFFVSNPKEIFKIYQKDFKYKFIKETPLNGRTVNEIDLYPNDLQKKYSRVRLQIDKVTSQIVSVKAFMKDGQQYLVTFDKFETNKDLPDSVFTFDKGKHADVEVIDLRF